MNLNEKLKSLRQKEKELLHEILLTIKMVDQTKLFLKMAYPSLFEYLVKEIGYCPASAQRRIDAVRLMEQVPVLGYKIASGSVSLSQVAKVQQAVRAAKKSGNSVSRETKQGIIEKLDHKSPRETEKILAEELQLEVSHQEKVRAQRDNSCKVELVFSKEEMTVLAQAKALLSNSANPANMHDLFIDLAERFVKSKTQARDPKVQQDGRQIHMHKTSGGTTQPNATTNTQSISAPNSTNNTRNSHNTHNTRNTQNAKPNTTPLKISIRKAVLRRDQGCQFVDPTTGRKCQSRHFLHYDHIQERQLGGDNSPENLRLLCGNHHRLRHSL